MFIGRYVRLLLIMMMDILSLYLLLGLCKGNGEKLERCSALECWINVIVSEFQWRFVRCVNEKIHKYAIDSHARLYCHSFAWIRACPLIQSYPIEFEKNRWFFSYRMDFRSDLLWIQRLIIVYEEESNSGFVANIVGYNNNNDINSRRTESTLSAHLNCIEYLWMNLSRLMLVSGFRLGPTR